MSDWGIFGQKGSGKTTLAARMSWEYRRRGIETIVLDPMRDDRWDTDYLFGSSHDKKHMNERQEFERCVRNSRGVAIFIDEAWQSMSQHDHQFDFLTRTGRHENRHVHYITHRPYDIDKDTRMLLEKLALFYLPNYKGALDELAEWWGDACLANADQLEKFEYYQTSLMGSAVKRRINPK